SVWSKEARTLTVVDLTALGPMSEYQPQCAESVVARPVAINECSEERYDQMLGIRPPTLWLEYGFLVGDPHGHRECVLSGQVLPTYAAFFGAKSRIPRRETAQLPGLAHAGVPCGILQTRC